MSKLSVDRPTLVDGLGRAKFARHLLQLVKSIDSTRSGAVIGLEGKWGAGKTYVLQSLIPLLEEEPESTRPVIVQFNPWMLSGTKQLVEALLSQVAAAIPSAARRRVFGFLRKTPNELASSIVGYAQVLGMVKNFASLANTVLPGADLAIEVLSRGADTAAAQIDALDKATKKIADHSSALSLVEARARVVRELERSGLRIVVLIDDLDRVLPAEFAAVIQAIKAVADFPNVVYVLAYDPDVAVEAVAHSHAVADGRAYMEKIVQLPVQLPDPPISKMREFARGRIESVISSQTTQLHASEREDVNKALQIVYALVKTPRDIERLTTRLTVSLPVLLGAVNVADVVILEALSLTFPKLLEWIRKNAEALMAFGLFQHDSDFNATGLMGDKGAFFAINDEERREAETRRATWRNLLPDDSRIRAPLVASMQFLFDQLGGRWEQPSKRSSYRRIQEFRYWYRWRCYHDHHSQWDVSDIGRFFSQPSTIIQSGLHSSEEAFVELCQHFCDLGDASLGASDAVAMASVFAEANRHIGTQAIATYGLGFGPMNALKIAIRTDSAHNRVEAIRVLITADSVWLSGLTIREAMQEREDENRRPEGSAWLVESPADLEDLKQEWRRLAVSSIISGNCFSLESDLSPQFFLTLMAQLGVPAAEVRILGSTFLDDDDAKLPLMFSAISDREAHRHFGIDADWTLLPSPIHMYHLASRRGVLDVRHKNFLRLLENRAAVAEAALALSAAIGRLAAARCRAGK